ncbi:MAG TPA: FAD binding domain-containing protein [Methylomirabilota bacterium]|jgi:carbon-monoxide dehydrogenase medium subunit|nr:FAD binding domain-containing protein [Methylomirabilota bacterium]
MKPVPFDYVSPRSSAETLEALARYGDEAKVLAGGQSLVPMLNMRLARPAVVVDVNGVGELDYLREEGGRLAVGALVRQRGLERWAATRLPLIAEALRWVGHEAIRTRGTVGGSIAHADPASELPAVLLCLDGAVVARRNGGERLIPAGELFVAPLTTSMRPDELLSEVRFSVPAADAGWGFTEVARRHGDFALVGAAALLWRGSDGRVTGARLAFFGAGQRAERGVAGEAALAGQPPTAVRLREAARAAAAALSPDSDLHATAEYRRRVAAVLAERALDAALGRAKATS